LKKKFHILWKNTIAYYNAGVLVMFKFKSRRIGSWKAGVPDGIFSNKIKNWVNFGGQYEMEHVGIFYCHLEYMTAIW
jgi:hypothetical protein